MNFKNVKAVTIPEGKVQRILAGEGVLWKNGYTNQVPVSIDTDGSIYNGTGYKDNYRIRSGGTETALSNSSCTGFIPVQGGDIVRFTGWALDFVTAGNAINVSDAAFTNLGQFTSQGSSYGIFNSAYADYGWGSVEEESDGVWKWIVPPAASGVAYIRVSGYEDGGPCPGANMTVTVNEEIS